MKALLLSLQTKFTNKQKIIALYTKDIHNDLKEKFSASIFETISQVADEMQLECYAIGGYVRDIFLHRPSKDIDIVTVGKGIELAEAITQKLGKGG